MALTYENQLQKIQTERAKWAARNFPNAGALHHIAGLAEEVGELAHAVLKMAPGTAGDTAIRGEKDAHLEAAADAVGDTIIYLLGICSDLGLDASECLDTAWDEVKHRDWVKYPTNGKDH